VRSHLARDRPEMLELRGFRESEKMEKNGRCRQGNKGKTPVMSRIYAVSSRYRCSSLEKGRCVKLYLSLYDDGGHTVKQSCSRLIVCRACYAVCE
jgi:hypothetical protein